MIVVAMFGALIMGGLVFSLLKRLGQSSGSQGKDSHIV
jgi:hypothetical protein